MTVQLNRSDANSYLITTQKQNVVQIQEVPHQGRYPFWSPQPPSPQR